MGAFIYDDKGKNLLLMSIFLHPNLEAATLEGFALLRACEGVEEESFSGFIIEVDEDLIHKGVVF